MMTKATQTNYTEAQTTQLVADYKAGMTVEAIAETLGKTTRSVVAKLSREGVYKTKTKPAATRVKKADLVDQIAAKCGVPAEQFESLEKANLDVLEALASKLA
jgi:predicted transcriptional regulator